MQIAAGDSEPDLVRNEVVKRGLKPQQVLYGSLAVRLEGHDLILIH
jgi:hypothetical protein